jgi:uroporphyrinogen decarboxylase
MMPKMSHKERVKAVLHGERPDRIPASTWRHFLNMEMTIQGEIDSLISFQKRYDWDYVKVNLRAHYHCEDWGVKCRYTGKPHDSPTLEDSPISTASDWGNLDVLDPSKGNLGEHLNVLRNLRREFGKELPLVMTMFTPLGIASRMVRSEDVLCKHLDENPRAVHAGLEAITQTFARYAPLCLEAGADGLFFATLGFGTYDRMTNAKYNEFGRPYDLRVLKQAQHGWFNVLHVCRSNNMLRALADYPVHAFNWDADDPTNPNLADGLKITRKPVIGGIPQQRIATMTCADVRKLVKDAVAQTGGLKFMVGSGCTMSTRTPHENLAVIIEALSEVS